MIRRQLGGMALLSALSIALVGPVWTRAQAQSNYPTQRITIIVGFAPGGPVDVIARIIGENLQRRWNQTVVIENRVGAGGNVAAAAVSRASADGYTLLFTATGVAINQSLYEKPGYAIRDLTPISIAASNSLIFAVHPSNPAKSFAALRELHRTKSFTFGTAGVGSGAHITAEYVFRVLAKVDAIHTPFQGSPKAVSALLGNHIDLVTVPLPDAIRHVQQGALRALVVSGTARVEGLPDVPTFPQVGIPDFASYGWIAMFAPARTPAVVAEKLNATVNQILDQPDVKARLGALGFGTNRQSFSETRTRLETEIENWRRMVEAIGLKIK